MIANQCTVRNHSDPRNPLNPGSDKMRWHISNHPVTLQSCSGASMRRRTAIRRASCPFPGAGDSRFVAYCRGFLLRQIAAQQPRLIITLGVTAAVVLAPLSPELAPWTVGRGLKHLDAAGPVRSGVTFPDQEDFSATV